MAEFELVETELEEGKPRTHEDDVDVDSPDARIQLDAIDNTETKAYTSENNDEPESDPISVMKEHLYEYFYKTLGDVNGQRPISKIPAWEQILLSAVMSFIGILLIQVSGEFWVKDLKYNDVPMVLMTGAFAASAGMLYFAYVFVNTKSTSHRFMRHV